MEVIAADLTERLVQLGGEVEEMAAPDGSGNYNIAVVEAARYLVLQGNHHFTQGHPDPVGRPSSRYVISLQRFCFDTDT